MDDGDVHESYIISTQHNNNIYYTCIYIINRYAKKQLLADAWVLISSRVPWLNESTG